MKSYFKLLSLLICVCLISCRSIISNPGKPLEDHSLELNHFYQIQDFTAKIYKIKITSVDNDCINGISKKGDMFSLDKKQIREVKKVKVMESIIVGIAAILAVIFVPI